MDKQITEEALNKMHMIYAEVDDLSRCLGLYLTEAHKQGRKPAQGDGAEWKSDGYGFSHLVKEGLPQGATSTAIERKIITIRDRLNELRKLVC